MGSPLLEVLDLRAEFRTSRGRLPVVDGVSFTLDTGGGLAIVGESGSGKTATALSLMRLLPDPPGRITGGRVLLRGRDLLALPEEALTAVRGRELAMVFQEPATALNPVMSVGEQIAEAVVQHRGVARRRVRPLVLESLDQAGVPEPETYLGSYPHQLSGGLRQRVMIAIALACGPSVLIADEPTTALDVTVQDRLLDLLAYLRHHLGLALLLITHDLGVVARLVDRVAVMYAGQIVETAPVAVFFRGPAHPYSRGLLQAARLEAVGPESRARWGGRPRLEVIGGSVPDLADLPPGCRFAPRCRWAGGGGPCWREVPGLREVGPGHLARCRRPGVGP